MSIPKDIRLTGGEEITWDEALRVAPGQTLVVGDCQVTLLTLEDPNELYMLNTLTRPGARRQGAMRRLSDVLYGMVDREGVTLVSHPDNEWLEQRMLARGWVHAPDRPEWEGRPCMVRSPRKLEPSDEEV